MGVDIHTDTDMSMDTDRMYARIRLPPNLPACRPAGQPACQPACICVHARALTYVYVFICIYACTDEVSRLQDPSQIHV